MTTLTKNTKVTYVQGSSAVPADPGRPAVAAHSETIVTVEWRPVYALQEIKHWASGPKNSIGQYSVQVTQLIPGGRIFQDPITLKYWNQVLLGYNRVEVPVTTYFPADPGKAPTAGMAGTPASLRADYNLGWNAGATSIGALEGTGSLSFSVQGSVQGVVVGLNDANLGAGYAAIRYGFYLSHDKAVVYEYGVSKSAAFTYYDGTVFSIQRRGPTVSYYIDDVLAYTSLISTDALLFADTSIYAGGDNIVGAALKSSVLGTSGANAVLEPIASEAYAGNYAQSAGRMLPLETVARGHTPVSIAGAMLPMISTGSNYAYNSSDASLESLTTEASAGALAPSYAVSSASFAYLQTAGHGLTGETGGGDVTLQPLQTLAANHPYASSAATLQAIDGVGNQFPKLNGTAYLTNPKNGIVRATATAREPNAFHGQLTGKLTAYAGAFARLTGKSGNLLIAGQNTAVGRARMQAKPGILVASGTVGGIVSAQLVNPKKPKVTAYSGAVLSVRIGGQSRVVASGTVGSVGRAVMRLPLCKLMASGSTDNVGRARLIGPALRPANSGRAYLVNPRCKLVAYGSAVVAVEYEAYAVNLLDGLDRNLQNQYDPNVDEVTHYSNYPFNQIVRFNDKYYGVASDGLYLLEGNTDNGAPIAWSFRTALADASSKQLKRVRSVYIGARLVSQAEVTLVVGEAQDLTYKYTTPRSHDAQNYRQLFGKGARTRYFAVEIADQNGSFIEVDSLDLETEILERAL